MNRILLVALASLVLVPAVGCGGGGGGIQQLVVTNLLDAGDGSLRDRIAAASPGAQITFAAGLVGPIPLTTGITIGKSLSIVGPGAGVVTVSGGNSVRPFLVPAGASVSISGLTVWQGLGTNGGGIRNEGNLTLNGVVVDSCVAPGSARGGGIHNAGGTLTAIDCMITGCAAYNGGGIMTQDGTTLLRRCTVSSCQTTGNSGAGVLNSDGVFTAVNCTFSGNGTTGTDRAGGAILGGSDLADCFTTILSCTITNNAATGPGGGIYIESSAPFAAHLSLHNSIVAGNTGTGGPDLDLVLGTVDGATSNFVGIGFNSTLTHGVGGNVVGSIAVPQIADLGPLANNGGPTLTHLPNPGSPVRDMVPTASCVDHTGAPLTVDQRGQPRPQGADADAGSVESP
jgi:hypothetical protein